MYVCMYLYYCQPAYHLANFTSRHLILGNIKKSIQGFTSKKMQPALFSATKKWKTNKIWSNNRILIIKISVQP